MDLSLNVKKTECMVISKKSSNTKCNLVSKGEKIKQVTKLKYLELPNNIRLEMLKLNSSSRNSHGQIHISKNENNTGKQKHKCNNPNKDKYKRYNNESSITHTTNNKQFDVLGDSARITGHFSLDSLTIAGLTIKNQSFGEALLETNLFRGTTNDGILGLGFNNLDGEEEPSVFDNMVSQGLVQAPVFSIYLSRYDSGGPDSVLTLGGTNPYYREEEFTFINLTVPHRWQFNIDRVQLSSGDDVFSESGSQAVVDLRSSFIAGPFEETRAINEQLGGILCRGPRGLYNYMFDCSEVDSLPDVEFIVNGKKLSLSSRDYTVEMELYGKDICASRILAMGWKENDGPDWVLGLNFMRAYYTQFDKGNHRIGFAKSLLVPKDIITREPL
ncbi:cathepsin d [Plakobranchus ocellatus]|uniref:Cathepsin d n=1 Tax=Plakobranchus ocellatus TaxID=259542 RepID=A0AAV3YRD2_9GAST|nr:cathepsin d [Plakobranchus ocellatus]